MRSGSIQWLRLASKSSSWSGHGQALQCTLRIEHPTPLAQLNKPGTIAVLTESEGSLGLPLVTTKRAAALPVALVNSRQVHSTAPCSTPAGPLGPELSGELINHLLLIESPELTTGGNHSGSILRRLDLPTRILPAHNGRL